MKLFIVPLVVCMIVHAIKLAIDIFKKRFSWKRSLGYGGMPSSHSALVASLATALYLTEGLSSAFGISVILAAIVMRDAMGFRGYLTKHGKAINKLIKDLPDEKEYKYPVMEETIAHTFWQIIVGAGLGIIITFFFF